MKKHLSFTEDEGGNTMYFGEPKFYLFKMQKGIADQFTRLSWPALCHHVKQFLPQAWIPELEEISFFRLGEVKEIFAFRGGRLEGMEEWESSLSPLFSQPGTQCHFKSLYLRRVTEDDLLRLMSAMQGQLADRYKAAIDEAYLKRRFRKAPYHLPNEFDLKENFVTDPDFPRLTPYFFQMSQFQVFDLLWICKRMDWTRDILVHVYG